MSSELIINADFYETRVALVENGQVAEFYVERTSDRGIGGNIYKGRVVRVLPGMQAAFVDINLEKAAFLYVSDVQHPVSDLEQLFLNSCDNRKRRRRCRGHGRASDGGAQRRSEFAAELH